LGILAPLALGDDPGGQGGIMKSKKIGTVQTINAETGEVLSKRRSAVPEPKPQLQPPPNTTVHTDPGTPSPPGYHYEEAE